MRNPFRRRESGGQEQRLLDTTSVSFPLDPLAVPAAVSEDGALSLTAALSAGRLIASCLASMPISVYRKNPDGTHQSLPVPSLFTNPCRQGTAGRWMFRAATSLVFRGNAVGVVMNRDFYEYPTRVEWLAPADVTCMDGQATQQMDMEGSFTNPIFYYMGTRLPTSDVVHIPWFQLPGHVWGISPMGAYARTVSTGLAAAQFTDDWFKNGGVPPGRFKNNSQTVSQREANVIKQRLMQAMRKHEPLVYGSDWEFDPFLINPAEARFIETQKMSATQIANVYGVPPEMVGGETGGSMSYSSPEQRQIELVQFTLLPWKVLFEDHLSALLPRGQYVHLDADVLIRADLKTRFEVYTKARLIGWDSVDGLRQSYEDLPPLPNGAGADYEPLPLEAGKTVSPPTVRNLLGDDDPRLHVVRDNEQGESNG